MSHHHDHKHHHHHEHQHRHDHDHHHDHDIQITLSFGEKMIKLLEHWIKHNDDHAGTYRDWGQKAKDNGMPETASLLEDAAEMTDKISKKFEAAAVTVKKT